ncbi:hypothetical protein [Catenulispora pinisilvae]|uniref:hypothetical protein n=1 Tax=Catenulispora pinisilvae TaxID=2705253 RepID=UPI00189207AC|nr:hypothetical protein [Catenulispora pinisilvae]
MAALAAAPLARWVALPEAVLTVAGAVVAVWAGLVLWLLSRMPLRWALRLVMAVNLLAASVVAAVSAASATVVVVGAVLAVAVDIGLFAASQAVALRALSVRSAS